MKAILIERDYKGQFERYALTCSEFEAEFAGEISEGMPTPCDIGQSWTLQPLVHIWYKETEIGSEEWDVFFTDMTWGLSHTDIANSNLAYIRTDFMGALYLEVKR